jgi:hypothetical protein
MKDTHQGGPAFPQQTNSLLSYSGMTLRDYFAAKAIQCICANSSWENWSNERLASEAYDFADAMLKAREA